MSSEVLKSRKTIDQQPQLDAWTPNLSILLMFDLIKKILGASRSSCPPIRFSLSLCVAIRACNMLHFHSCCMSLSHTHSQRGCLSLWRRFLDLAAGDGHPLVALSGLPERGPNARRPHARRAHAARRGRGRASAEGARVAPTRA